jgi:hypothetical protein
MLAAVSLHPVTYGKSKLPWEWTRMSSGGAIPPANDLYARGGAIIQSRDHAQMKSYGMTEEELLRQDDAVAQAALAALSLAQRKALESGRPVVLLVGRKLVRLSADGHSVVLKELPGRQRVMNRTKHAQQ